MNKLFPTFRVLSTILFLAVYSLMLSKPLLFDQEPTYLDVLVTIANTFWYCTVMSANPKTSYKWMVIQILITTLLLTLAIEDIKNTTSFMGEPIFEYYAGEVISSVFGNVVSGIPTDVTSVISTTEMYDLAMKVETVMIMLLLLIGTLSRQNVKKLLK